MSSESPETANASSPVVVTALTRQRSRGRKLLFGLFTCLMVIFIAESILRLTGRPRGTFRGVFTTTNGLWEPNFSGDLEFGPFTYRVQANAHGFRGPELRTGLRAARTRIVCIGDSITDGFYVDNDATYPHFLQEALLADGHDVEVINAARGGGSINKFYIILRDIVLPLEPDIVVVTFVTNDISDLGGRNVEDLLSARVDAGQRGSLAGWIICRTALGETLMDAVLRLRSPMYRREQRFPSQHATTSTTADAGSSSQTSGSTIRPDDPRYRIAGADRYEENAQTFLKRWADVDGRVLGRELDDDVRRGLETYLTIFDRFEVLCRRHNIRMLYVYFPAYSQVYLPDAPTTIKDLLHLHVHSVGIPFLDLTEAFRRASAEGPIHLAPVDWHLNPRGNQVMAQAVAEKLKTLGWMK